jgi:two-component system chemotaxis response regulator CheY
MKVLVVDDDVVSRMMLVHLIDSSGHFDIVEAEDGADAWQQLRDGLRPALCFCDLRMPRLSGMELLQKVRGDAALAAMPFVLVSSANDRDTVELATQAGATGYIVKPFDQVQVRAQLDALVGRDRAEDPTATQARLGIDAERLRAYLAGFETQLLAAEAELEILLGRGDVAEAAGRLERLCAGCATLGLHGAHATLAAFDPAAHASALGPALAIALQAVRSQAQRLRA